MVRQSKIRLCLFGYNKREVDKYVEEVKNNNEEKIDEINNRIQNLRDENEKIIKEIELLYDEKGTDLQSEEFMNFSLEKHEEWSHLMKRASYHNTCQIISMVEKQGEILNLKIREFDDRIKNIEEQLHKLLSNILKENEIASENLKMFINHKRSQKFNKTQMEYENLSEDIITQREFSVNDDNEEDEDYKIKNNIGENISDVRSKYLVGKIAGEDLFDNNNKLIVAKNSVITRKTVKLAEREGKLSELIINMVLP